MIQKFGTAANQSYPPFIFTHGYDRVPVVASSHRGDRGDYGNGGTPTCLSWKIPWQWMIYGTPISGNHQMLSVVTTSILSNSHQRGSFARKTWTFPMERTDDNWWNHAETHCGVDTQPALFFQRRAALRGSSLGYPVLWPFMSFWKVPKNTCYEYI